MADIDLFFDLVAEHLPSELDDLDSADIEIKHWVVVEDDLGAMASARPLTHPERQSHPPTRPRSVSSAPVNARPRPGESDYDWKARPQANRIQRVVRRSWHLSHKPWSINAVVRRS
jgi:hypothetical protein